MKRKNWVKPKMVVLTKIPQGESLFFACKAPHINCAGATDNFYECCYVNAKTGGCPGPCKDFARS